MINKNIFTKDIFEDARIRSERLKMISSLSSEKKWNELLNFVKNNQGGLIELTVLPIFQKFLFYFLILIPPIYLFFFNVAYQILITTCDSLDYQVNNIIIKTTLDYQDNFIIKTMCSIWENIISEKKFYFLIS